MDVVRAQHHIHVRRALADRVPILLGQATGDDDLATFLLRLPRLQVAEVAVEPVVRVLPDAARVEHDHIGVGLIVHLDEPLVVEQPRDALGVVLVHLTPVGVDDVAPGHGGSGYLATCDENREIPGWPPSSDDGHPEGRDPRAEARGSVS